MIKVVKKDGAKEDFNVQKVVVAVNKSAYRALIKFTEEELDFICKFVEDEVKRMGLSEIQIAQMHNVVEGALEKVNPVVAKSYRDYRNYKQDFVQMLDEVYKKSQSIMYVGDKENANIVRKIERELRKLKGIPKLDVKYTFATNVQAYGSGETTKSKKR